MVLEEPPRGVAEVAEGLMFSAYRDELAVEMPELADVLSWPETDLMADLRVARRAQGSRE